MAVDSVSKAKRTLRRKAEKILAERPKRVSGASAKDGDHLVHELSVHEIELEMQNEELQKAQLETEASRSRYLDLYDYAPVGYLTFDENGLVSELNLTAAHLLGIERGLVVNRSFTGFIQPDYQDTFYLHGRKALETAGTHICELVLKSKGRSSFHAQLESSRVELDGRWAIRSILTDISERKQREQERDRHRAEVAHLASFPERNPNPVVEAGLGGVIHYLNPAAEKLLPDLRTAGPLHPWMADLESMAARFRQGATSVAREVRLGGSWYEQRLYYVAQTARIRIYGTDITERKQIQDVQLFLLEQGWSGEDFFQSLARYLAKTLDMDYVCIDRLEGDCLSAQTVAVYFDGKFEDNVAYTLKDTPCGDVVGKTICSFPAGVRHLFPRDGVLQEMMAESYVGTTLWSSQGQPIGLIAMISRKPAADLRLAESIVKLVGIRAAGELERRQGAEQLRRARDELEVRVQERTAELQKSCEMLQQEIAQRKEVEEQFRQAQKMEAIGTLAGGIAHDFNNILAAIVGFSELALGKLPEGSPVRLHMERIFTAGIRGRDLVKQILAFSRQAEQEKRRLKLAPVVRETSSFSGPRSPARSLSRRTSRRRGGPSLRTRPRCSKSS